MSQNKKITVMIQARTGSSRLPNKVLEKIENKPMIWYVINRVKQIKSVQQIALITTKETSDQALLKIAENEGIIGFAGNTNDVLDRHFQCALNFDADPIIRITGDCPLIDPFLVEEILQFYLNNNFDYVSNTINPTYPDGLDTEIFSFNTLKKLMNHAKLPSEREHVTLFIKNNPHMFKFFNYKNNKDLSNLRWTVDETLDLKLIREIYSIMKPETIFSMDKILKIILNSPHLLKINREIKRNEGLLKSFQKDNEI